MTDQHTSNASTTNAAAPDRSTTWAMLCHLAALSGYIGVPFAHIVGPLVVWLLKRDEYPLVDDQGRESLNFQITWSIWIVLSIPLCFLLVGIPILIALLIGGFVLTLIATVKASDGVAYRYPLTIRFLRPRFVGD